MGGEGNIRQDLLPLSGTQSTVTASVHSRGQRLLQVLLNTALAHFQPECWRNMQIEKGGIWSVLHVFILSGPETG